MKQDITYYLKYIGIPFLVIAIIVTVYAFRDLEEDPLTESEESNSNGEVSIEGPMPVDQIDVPVLVYHQIRNYQSRDTAEARQYITPPSQLERHFDYLTDNNYTTLTFEDIQLILDGERNLPEKPVVLAFDDGSISIYRNALPLLSEHDFKAVFSIFTNSPQNSNYLSWDQIRELDEAGHEIASHSVLHPFLLEASNEKLNFEIIESKRVLEEELGHEIQTFVYPFGQYNEKIINIVQEAGYSFGRSLDHSYSIKREAPYTVGGFVMPGEFEYFVSILEGVK